MFASGWKKVVPQGGLVNFSLYVAALGFPYWFGYIAAFAEFLGGLALILGIFTSLASVFIAVDMGVALIRVHSYHGATGLSAYEFPLSLLALSLLILAAGPGWLALEDAIPSKH